MNLLISKMQIIIHSTFFFLTGMSSVVQTIRKCHCYTESLASDLSYSGRGPRWNWGSLILKLFLGAWMLLSRSRLAFGYNRHGEHRANRLWTVSWHLILLQDPSSHPHSCKSVKTNHVFRQKPKRLTSHHRIKRLTCRLLLQNPIVHSITSIIQNLTKNLLVSEGIV